MTSDDLPPPAVQVGDFTIQPSHREGYIYIHTLGGEGGEFRADLFEAAIREFYDRHF